MTLMEEVYATPDESDLRVTSIDTHDVRTIATSLALQVTHALPQILAAATWKSPTTFTSYCLRDCRDNRGSAYHGTMPCRRSQVALDLLASFVLPTKEQGKSQLFNLRPV